MSNGPKTRSRQLFDLTAVPQERFRPGRSIAAAVTGKGHARRRIDIDEDIDRGGEKYHGQRGGVEAAAGGDRADTDKHGPEGPRGEIGKARRAFHVLDNFARYTVPSRNKSDEMSARRVGGAPVFELDRASLPLTPGRSIRRGTSLSDGPPSNVLPPSSRATRISAVKVALLAILPGARAARADNGYYQGELGPRATGRAGAIVARADDLTAVSYNPAGLADLKGTQIEIGDRLSYNAFGYTRAPTLDYGISSSAPPRTSFATVFNSKRVQALEPFVGIASKLGTRNWGFALAAFAPPGNASLSYPENGGQRYLMVDRQAQILEYAASVAWKYEELFGLGATFEWIYVRQLDYSLIIDGTPSARPDTPVTSPLDILSTTRGSSKFTPNT